MRTNRPSQGYWKGLATMIRFSLSWILADGYSVPVLRKKNNRIKGLLWEGDGFLLLYKRLEVGAYSWPPKYIRSS
ncbi:MAG: IS66 family insertion sequence element accessory protein TnpB [Agathobacter rectalis]